MPSVGGGGGGGVAEAGMDIFWDYAVGLPCMMISLFYIGKPVVQTDGLRSRDYQDFSDG